MEEPRAKDAAPPMCRGGGSIFIARPRSTATSPSPSSPLLHDGEAKGEEDEATGREEKARAEEEAEDVAGGKEEEAEDVAGGEEGATGSAEEKAAAVHQTAASDALSVVILSELTKLQQRKEELKRRKEQVSQKEVDMERLEQQLTRKEKGLRGREDTVTQREETVVLKEKERDVWWEHLKQWEAEVEERQLDADHICAELQRWVKRAEAEWSDRGRRLRRREDDLRWAQLLLKDAQNVEETQLRREMALRARGYFESSFLGWKDGRVDEGRASLTQPLLQPQPTQMTKPMPPTCNTPAPATDTAVANATDEAVPEGVDTVIGMPHSKGDDEIWNKRQIGYVFYLGTAMGLVFLLCPLLPSGYNQWMLLAFAAIWGLGSVGLPVGMFGTSRFEKEFSRHVGQFIAMCCSLMVIYGIYLLTLHVDGSPTSALPPPPSPGGQVPTDHGDAVWRIRYGFVGGLVLGGHLYSWGRGCYTGGDRDMEP